MTEIYLTILTLKSNKEFVIIAHCFCLMDYDGVSKRVIITFTEADFWDQL